MENFLFDNGPISDNEAENEAENEEKDGNEDVMPMETCNNNEDKVLVCLIY